ncbi:MAG: hypothetical protein ACYC1T_09905 [Sulfuricaulis sp.]
MRWLLLQDSAWREPLYGATANGALHENLRAHTRRLLDRLPQLVASLSPEDLIQAPIPVAKRLDQISAKTRFQRIPDAVLEVEPNKSPQGLTVVNVRLGHSGSSTRISARLEIPAGVLAVFRWTEGQTKPFTGAGAQTAFPALPFEELKKILATLTRAQFIKMFWFAELAPQARVGTISR